MSRGKEKGEENEGMSWKQAPKPKVKEGYQHTRLVLSLIHSIRADDLGQHHSIFLAFVF